MGCDIHMIVEVKAPSRKGGDPYWHGVTRTYEVHTLKGQLRIEHRWYSGRNYNEFAILADVRNGRGFAGIETGEGFVPLAAPKGFPSDASEEAETMNRELDGDGHSHSHLTLKELIATPEYWSQETKFSGDPNPYKYEQAAPFIKGILIPALQELRTDYYFTLAFDIGRRELSEEDVRIVFLFDN